MEGARRRGIELFHELNVASRPFGMVGMLGGLVGRWLHDTLPLDAASKCSEGRATLLVTTLPSFRTRPISDFACRADLIKCIMASAHIPLVMDWRMYVSSRGSACIDGGLWCALRLGVKRTGARDSEQRSRALNL